MRPIPIDSGRGVRTVSFVGDLTFRMASTECARASTRRTGIAWAAIRDMGRATRTVLFWLSRADASIVRIRGKMRQPWPRAPGLQCACGIDPRCPRSRHALAPLADIDCYCIA